MNLYIYVTMHKMDQNVKNFFTEDEPTATIYNGHYTQG